MADIPQSARPDFSITGITFVSAYVDDFPTAYAFYTELLGLEKEYDMGDLACFLKLNEQSGLYLQGGNKPDARVNEESVRASFTFSVDSVDALWEQLKMAGVKCVQPAPRDMGGGWFWFQFFDPAGNLIEAVGEK